MNQKAAVQQLLAGINASFANPEVHSHRDITDKKGTIIGSIKQCMVRTKASLDDATSMSGKLCLFLREAARPGKVVQHFAKVWLQPRVATQLVEAAALLRRVEGHRGLIFSDRGLGLRVDPSHIGPARLLLLPDDEW